MAPDRLLRHTPVVVVGVSLILFPFLVKDHVWQNLGILVLVNATAATAWNLLGGYAGQISFGHSIFFGIGAYATGLAVLHGSSPWLGLVLGSLLAMAAGVAMGFPVFRLRSHYFSIATIAMQQVIFILVVNRPELGRATGLELPIREHSLANLQFSIRDLEDYYLVALAMFGAATLAVWLYLRGRTGSYIRAIRDDEEVARAMGVPVRRHKLHAIAVSAAITAVAGGFYGMYSLFVDPNVVLSLDYSILFVLVAVLGGAGVLWGPLVGAAVLGIIQAESKLQLQGHGNALDLIIYGTLVVVIAVLEPSGIVGLARRVQRMLRAQRRRPAAPVEEGA